MSNYAFFCGDCEYFRSVTTSGEGICKIRQEKCKSSNICRITNGVDDYYDYL